MMIERVEKKIAKPPKETMSLRLRPATIEKISKLCAALNRKPAEALAIFVESQFPAKVETLRDILEKKSPPE